MTQTDVGLEPTSTETPATPETGEQGAADLGTQTSESTETATPRTFSVNVDGQEKQISEDELVNGYLRQSDFTRKTQAVAAERERLQAAEALWQHIQNDPQGTLEQLQAHYANQLDADNLDPEEQRLRAVEEVIERQQQQELKANLDQELGRIAEVHGEFDVDELLEFAISNEIGSLEAALVYSRQLNQASVEGEATRQAAKENAPPIATRGSQAAGSVSDPPEELHTIEDAIAAAKKELGVTSIMDLL